MNRWSNNNGYEFIRCGHIFAEWNIINVKMKKGGIYRRCRQCNRKVNRLASRKRRQLAPPNRRPKLGRNFPCGHPRTEKNSERSGPYNSARCKQCKSIAHKKRWESGHRSPWQLSRKKNTHVNCAYESDIQCNRCGYMLRFKNGTHADKCVVCIRQWDRAAYARKKKKAQLLASANKADTSPSNVNRASREGLTDMADLRQDGPP